MATNWRRSKRVGVADKGGDDSHDVVEDYDL
jgi:hypothetical protein